MAAPEEPESRGATDARAVAMTTALVPNAQNCERRLSGVGGEMSAAGAESGDACARREHDVRGTEAAQKLRDDMPSDMFIDELFHHRRALAASALAISGCFVPPRMDTRDAPPALPTARDVNLGAVCVSGQTRDPMMGFAYLSLIHI